LRLFVSVLLLVSLIVVSQSVFTPTANLFPRIGTINSQNRANQVPMQSANETHGFGWIAEPIPPGTRKTWPPPLAGVQLPTHFDWRDKDGYNWMTPVEDQNPCRGCVAYAVIGATEAVFKIASNDPSWNLDLSEQHLFSCGQGGICSAGWTFTPAFSYLENYGTPDAACYPKNSGPQVPCSGTCADWQSRAYKLSDAQYVSADPYDIEQALMQYGPLVAGFTVYSDFEPFFLFNPTGVYYHNPNFPSTGDGHAVVIVGFDSGQKYWILKNSWGTSWGDHGYFEMGWYEAGIENSVAYVVPGSRPSRVVTQTTSLPNQVPITIYSVLAGQTPGSQNDLGASITANYVSGGTSSTFTNVTPYTLYVDPFSFVSFSVDTAPQGYAFAHKWTDLGVSWGGVTLTYNVLAVISHSTAAFFTKPVISLSSTNWNYGDTVSWAASGLTPSTAIGVLIQGGWGSLRFTDATTDASGNAKSQFSVGMNIQGPGQFTLVDKTTNFVLASASYTIISASTTSPVPSYVITVNTSPPGLSVPITGGGTYPFGWNLGISVGFATGYTFVKWLKDGVDFTNQQTFLYVVDGSHTFTAVFSQNTYSATFQESGIPGGFSWGVSVGGTFYPTSSSYTAITVVGLSGTVSYYYDSSEQGSGGTYFCVSGCSGSVSGPTTVTATYTFQPNSLTSTTIPQAGYTVTFYTNPNSFLSAPSEGSISACGNTFYDGQSSTNCGTSFTATANSLGSNDWQFSGWEWSEGVSCADLRANPVSCAVTGSGSVRAQYEAAVTFHSVPSNGGTIMWLDESSACPISQSPAFPDGGVVTDYRLPPEFNNNRVLCAIPAAGYAFLAWSSSGGVALMSSPSSNPVTGSFTGPGTVTAHFSSTQTTTAQSTTTSVVTVTALSTTSVTLLVSATSGNQPFNNATSTIVQISSNSTISGLQFDSSRSLLNFTASGPAGTVGYTSVVMAKGLINGNPIVLVDNGKTPLMSLNYASNSTHYFISFSYSHSTHNVSIGGSNTVSEFQNGPIISMSGLLILIVVLLTSRKRQTRTKY
jgi:hypothetical protein